MEECIMNTTQRNDCLAHAYNNIQACKHDQFRNNGQALQDLEALVLNLLHRLTEFDIQDTSDKISIYQHAFQYIRLQIIALENLIKKFEHSNQKIYFRLQIRLEEFQTLKKVVLIEIDQLKKI